MADVGGIYVSPWHGIMVDSGGSIAFSGENVLDGTADLASIIFCAKESGNVGTLGIRINSVTGTPESNSYQISLQTLGATGNPSGTILGATNSAKCIWTPDTTTGFVWLTLSEVGAITKGTCYAIVIQKVTDDATGNYIGVTLGMGAFLRHAVPYTDSSSNSGSTWTKSSARWPIYGYKISAAIYGNPISALYTTDWATNGDRIGMAFTLPSAMGSTFTLAGIRFIGRINPTSTGRTFKVAVRAGTTPFAEQGSSETSFDADALGVTAETGFILYFDSPPTLNFGTKYYVTIESADGSFGQFSMHGFSVVASADMAALPGGSAFCLVTYDLSETTWAETNTTRPLCEFIISDWTVPAAPDYPAESDVRYGVDYDSAAKTGTCAVPVAGDVENGVAVDATTGTFVVPAEGDVEDGVGYGAGGTEFEGTLVAGGPSGGGQPVLGGGVVR